MGSGIIREIEAALLWRPDLIPRKYGLDQATTPVTFQISRAGRRDEVCGVIIPIALFSCNLKLQFLIRDFPEQASFGTHKQARKVTIANVCAKTV